MNIEKIFLAPFLLFLTSACTYSITMAHTQGTATDLIDETQSAQPDIKPTFTIPAL